ncbi:MAG TPA: hypothetical protein DDW49_10000 [Deltaproteobacteria bacterium]|nr:MAG: hypothetical protein A2048_02700 [Deltaproteobacteria bacterium GWA2_45_12]HBF13696.1 hypothetical protein [Deltaproteobacteria bacterium]
MKLGGLPPSSSFPGLWTHLSNVTPAKPALELFYRGLILGTPRISEGGGPVIDSRPKNPASRGYVAGMTAFFFILDTCLCFDTL